MSDEQLRPLKQTLLDEYGHFADQRIKKIDTGSVFIVDNRGPGDYGADRKLFLWFCSIFANVVEPNAVEITMRGGIPRSAAVEAWIKKYAADDEKYGLSFRVTPDDLDKLPALAKAVRSIIRARYSVKAYKYVCPRTAASLERLHAKLSKHWSKS
jgi:hypothetical protein